VALRFAVSHEKIPDIEPISFEIIEMRAGDNPPSDPVPAQNVTSEKPVPETVHPEPKKTETLIQKNETPRLPKEKEHVVPIRIPHEKEKPTPEKTVKSPVKPAAITKEITEENPKAAASPAQEKPDGDTAAEKPILCNSPVSVRTVIQPKAKNRIVPIYPRSARRRNREGCVSVKAHIAEDGTVTKTEVVASSGYDDLDLAATKAINTAAFVPAEKNGRPASGELLLVFEFKLK
jgi:protein TonB